MGSRRSSGSDRSPEGGAGILSKVLDDGAFTPPAPKNRDRAGGGDRNDGGSGSDNDPIRTYTNDSDELNKYLRATDKSSYSPEDRARLDKQADDISKALKDRPVPEERTSWRGLPAGPWLDKYKKGDLYSDPAFMSTSTNKRVAENFQTIAMGGFSGNHVPGAMFKVNGATGRDVGDNSSFKHQNEVLFDRGALFKITDKRQEGNTTVVDLTQLA